MKRRHILQSLLLTPLALLRGKRAGPFPEPPLGPDVSADDYVDGRLPEVAWASLTREEQAVLIHAATAVDGSASAVFPWEFFTRGRMKVLDRLFRLGLLTFTSKMPEHRGDLCGWYSLSHYGREIVPATV